ncbi:MAG: MerR family transcriptional regulator [Desulfovibrionaceae bacterium]|nr:MerR family transcriptional regulator [Desulfovibrionaceae bacterium]MBF0512485.1 MerR family transcriptional regulator [Desulfovibrionaceae bacterium]
MDLSTPDDIKTVTHEDLARDLGVSVTTVKNYRRQFGAFLPIAREGRPLRFHATSLEVCRKIRSLFGDGLPVKKITEVLSLEFPSFFKYRHLSKASGSTHGPISLEDLSPMANEQSGPAEGLPERLKAVETLFENTSRRVSRVEKLLEDLFALHNRSNTLQNELLAKLESLIELPGKTGYAVGPSQGVSRKEARPEVAEEAASPGYAQRVSPDDLFAPPADLALLPVVIFSELGEFLGVTDKKGRPFTLKEFQAFLERRAAGLGKFDSTWSLDQDAWVLTFGGSGPSSGQVHDHYFRRTKTTKGNLVAHFYQLRINGNVVTKAFLHAFLRQIKDFLE